MLALILRLTLRQERWSSEGHALGAGENPGMGLKRLSKHRDWPVCTGGCLLEEPDLGRDQFRLSVC